GTRSDSSARSSCRPCREAALRGEQADVVQRKPSKETRRGRLPGRSVPANWVRVALIVASFTVVVLAAYVVARDTSMFAVRTLAISGGSPRARAEAEHALGS